MILCFQDEGKKKKKGDFVISVRRSLHDLSLATIIFFSFLSTQTECVEVVMLSRSTLFAEGMQWISN